jgi:hypothetical protein
MPSGGGRPMSALGQKPAFAPQNVMSASPPIATPIASFGTSALGQKRTLPLKRGGLLDARAVHCPEIVVAGR